MEYQLIQTVTRSALTKPKCNMNCPYNNTICQTKDAIYQLTCTECGEIYVGETGRKIHTRAKEHDRSIFTQTGNSAMKEHYQTKHPNILNNKPFSIKILDRASNVTNRRIRESVFINKLHPSINRDCGWFTSSYRKK